MTVQEIEEGMLCPQCEDGIGEFEVAEGCSCHKNPPCSACVNTQIFCPNCGYTNGENE